MNKISVIFFKLLPIFLTFKKEFAQAEIPPHVERGKLFLGKIPPGEFNMVDLNGLYTPQDAINKCEESLQCAGFTYKGLSNSTLFKDKKYDVYFFYYVPWVDTNRLFSNYVSYFTTKTFGIFDGKFKGLHVDLEESKKETWISTIVDRIKPYIPFLEHKEQEKGSEEAFDPEAYDWVSADTVAFVVDAHAPHGQKSVMSYINLHEFEPNERDVEGELLDISDNVDASVTFLNFNASNEFIQDVALEIDFKCPQHDHKEKVAEWKLPDQLPRISCKNVTVEQFTRDYIDTQTPVMLTDCMDEWPSNKKWKDFQAMFSRYGSDKVWKTDVSFRAKRNPTVYIYGRKHYDLGFEPGSPESFMKNEDGLEYSVDELPKNRINDWVKDGSYDDIKLTGPEILDFMRRNITMRVFDRIGTPPRRNRTDSKMLKRDLFADYSWPASIPNDLMKPIFGGTDYQWVIISQGSTGTHVHHDPQLTDAWNALFTGRKAWVVFPKDVHIEGYECQDLQDELFAVSWWNHVVPQLRNENWYGNHIIEAVQKAGEIIFIPQGLGHAVLNLDDNISVTENYLHASGFDELTKAYAYGLNPLQYHSDAAAERMWKNLVYGGQVDAKYRRFLIEMLKQAKSAPYDESEREDEVDRWNTISYE